MKLKHIGLLIDLDGTLYKGNNKINGADVFIDRLRGLDLPFQFVTNNSSRTPESVADHLTQMGIDADSSEVYTAAQAAAQYLIEDDQGKSVFMIGEQGLECALVEAGFKITDEMPDYVVQGIDRQFNYAKLKQAVQSIQAGAKSILTNPDLLLPSDNGLIPGAGSISAAIEAGSGVKPVVIGKPSSIITGYAIKRLNLAPDQIWMVGDNMMTDIGAGKSAGCKTALVLTGVATKANLEAQIQKAGFEPDVVCDDLPHFLDWLQANNL